MTHRWDTRGADAEVGPGGGSESSDALAAHVLASIERAKEGIGVHCRGDKHRWRKSVGIEKTTDENGRTLRLNLDQAEEGQAVLLDCELQVSHGSQ